jgi:hypothetical protein
VLLLLNLAQLTLFAAANMQLERAVQGSYQFDPYLAHLRTADERKAASVPGAVDWVLFTAVHVASVIDVFDEIELIGEQLVPLKHQGLVASFLLIWLHLTVAVFLAQLLETYRREILQTIGAVSLAAGSLYSTKTSRGPFTVLTVVVTLAMFPLWWKIAAGDRMHPWLRLFGVAVFFLPFIVILGVIFRADQEPRRTRFSPRFWFGFWGTCLAILLLLPVLFGWNVIDSVMFPLDSLAKVIDVGDVFSIADWKLHRVPMNVGSTLLAMATRLVMGCMVGYAVVLLRRRLGLLHGPR